MKRVANAFSAMVFIAVVFIFVPACNFSGDTARVTIDTGLRNQAAANVSLFDRFLALVSLSKPAQADPAPVSVYRITISVTGNGISSMNDIEIPLDTGMITLDVPAGSGRTFTVIGWNESSQREYGGIKTIDLSGGSTVNLTIQMGLLPSSPDTISPSTWVNGVRLQWEYSSAEPEGLVGFKIYQAPRTSGYINPDLHGPYVPIVEGRKEDFYPGSWYDYEYLVPDEVVNFDYYYFGVSATNQYGEGEPNYYAYYYC